MTRTVRSGRLRSIVTASTGVRVIEKRCLDDGNRKRRGDDLRSLDRPERSARNGDVDVFGSKSVCQLLRLLSSAVGQRRSRRRRVGADEPFGVAFTLGVSGDNEAVHWSRRLTRWGPSRKAGLSIAFDGNRHSDQR
jgi:hypothetical protein